MPVHILTGLLPWLLFNIILLFTGVSGSELTVYSSAGELVSLPCNLHGSFNCPSITWNWISVVSKGTIELVAHGVVVAEDQQLAKRLRVGINCSLHINDLTTADAGQYYCRQYHNKKDYTEASVINLSIVNIFASSPVTELKIGSTGVSGSEPTVYSSAGVPVSHSYTTSFPGVSGSEPTVYSSAGVLVSHSYTTSFPGKITRDVWIGSGVAICVAVVLIVILIMICRRRTVQRKMAYNHVSQSHTVTDQNTGESEDTITYAVVNPSAGGKRKQDQESAVLETEYAIIKTAQNSNKP